MKPTRDIKHRPHPDYRFWLYDPEGDGMTYYRTQEARDAEAAKTIAAHLDDEWSEEVDAVAAGEVTHCAQVIDKQMRPDDLDDDDEGFDVEGTYWAPGVEWRGNYTLEPLPEREAIQAEGE